MKLIQSDRSDVCVLLSANRTFLHIPIVKIAVAIDGRRYFVLDESSTVNGDSGRLGSERESAKLGARKSDNGKK